MSDKNVDRLEDRRPIWWFRPIDVINDLLDSEPDAIEYLKISTGETFIHTFGTAFWRDREKFDVSSMEMCKITHWRVKPAGYSESTVESSSLPHYKKGGPTGGFGYQRPVPYEDERYHAT